MQTTLQPVALAIYLAGLAVILLVGLYAYRRSRDNGRGRGGRHLLDDFIQRSPPPPRKERRRVPRSSTDSLEGRLRTAIFDAAARERLVREALPSTGGNRDEAIRKVLRDLAADNQRYD